MLYLIYRFGYTELYGGFMKKEISIMAEKMNLKSMKCPTCGAPLKVENGNDTIVCVYCGNSIVPVNEAAPVQNEAVSGGAGATLKVAIEKINTSSSALAYIEQFFEEYDWEFFAYAQSLSINEIDKLARNLKTTSADDKNTWIVCFKAAFVPFVHKVEGCKEILESVIEEYKKDSLDAYSKFDAYKRIAIMISAQKNNIVSNLEKLSEKAKKYGASEEELKAMQDDVNTVKNIADVVVYNSIEDISEIIAFNEEKTAKIVKSLAEKGIDAEAEYNRAKQLISEQKYVEALSLLLSLDGYLDTNALIEKIDKYYLISDVLEVEGKLYFFRKSPNDPSVNNLYYTKDGSITDRVVISNIGMIITNYADIIYYLDGSKKLKKYNLSTNKMEQIHKSFIKKDEVFVYGRKVYLLAYNSGSTASYANYTTSTANYDLIELDISTGNVKVVVEAIKEIVSRTDNKMVYIQAKKRAGSESDFDKLVNVINLDTMQIVEFGAKKITIEGFVNDYAVYTQDSPNKYNKNLYIKSLVSDEPEKLVEANIYRFCDLINDKIFYYIGNSRNESLIIADYDGSDRKEWPLYISDILFEQAGWLYFTRKSGYNSVLCKSRLDGSRFSIIASDIDKFIDFKNGYLYYINFASTLVKVRLDGSNLQELCDDVQDVLSVKEDKIIFVSLDDRLNQSAMEQLTNKVVKSIYAVDFSGNGKIKLAYNVKTAKTYDDNTVYYIAGQDIKASYNKLSKNAEYLYKIDVETNQTEELLKLQLPVIEQEKMSKLTIALIVMGISVFLGILFLSAGVAFLGIVSMLVSFGALFFALSELMKKNQNGSGNTFSAMLNNDSVKNIIEKTDKVSSVISDNKKKATDAVNKIIKK